MSSVLRQGRAPTWEIGVSMLGHIVLVGVLLAFEAFGGSEPEGFKPEEVTWIAAAPPKKKAGLPQTAMRRPDPPKGEQAPEQPPPPPKSSEMSLPSDDAPKTPGEDKPEPTPDQTPQTNAAKRENLLNNLNAPIGPEDREATDPNGVEGSVAMVGQPGGINDPELVAWNELLKKAIRANWVLPPGGSKWKSHEVAIVVKIDASGKMTAPKVVAKSGDATFDRSATMAIYKTKRVPPPPGAWAGRISGGYQLIMQGGEML